MRGRRRRRRRDRAGPLTLTSTHRLASPSVFSSRRTVFERDGSMYGFLTMTPRSPVLETSPLSHTMKPRSVKSHDATHTDRRHQAKVYRQPHGVRRQAAIVSGCKRNRLVVDGELVGCIWCTKYQGRADRKMGERARAGARRWWAGGGDPTKQPTENGVDTLTPNDSSRAAHRGLRVQVLLPRGPSTLRDRPPLSRGGERPVHREVGS